MNVRLAWTWLLPAAICTLMADHAAAQMGAIGEAGAHGAANRSPGYDSQRYVQGQTLLIRKVCQPTDGQVAALERVGEWLVNSQATATLVDDRLENAVLATLGAEQAARYQHERRQNDVQLMRSRITRCVAVIGERLLLTRRQSVQLCRLMEARWSHAGPASWDWSAVDDGGIPLFRQANGRGREMLSYQLPGLPDADWMVILRPTQRTYWQELHGPRRAAHLAVAERLEHLAAIERVAARRRPPVVVDDGDERVQDVAAGDEEQAEELADRPAPAPPAEAPVLDIAGGATGIAPFVALLLDDIDVAVELSEGQRHKLLLAAKADIKRYEKLLATVEHGLADRLKKGQAVHLAGEQQLVDSPTAVVSDESSSFGKLLRRVLSDEQAREFARVERGRRRFAAEAAWRGALSALAESRPITSVQWSELILLSEEQLNAVDTTSLAPSPRAIKVPLERLTRVLDDDDLATLTLLLGQLWKVEP